jgi:hypothetical protein
VSGCEGVHGALVGLAASDGAVDGVAVEVVTPKCGLGAQTG